MPDHARTGLLRHVLGALKRAVLGKSSHEYLSQFTGNDEYWERAIAGQRRHHESRPPQSDADDALLSHNGLVDDAP
jgi:hypothetical protein